MAYFANRVDAGKQLATELKKFKWKKRNVLAIPEEE